MLELKRNAAWATVFLTLKDPRTGATLKATIGRGAYDRLDLGLEEGETVHVQGRAELYEARGELGLRATAIERIGLGEHLLALERLKRRLAGEGLFARERKRPLPRLPRAIGVLTGADAAARGDFLTTVGKRFRASRIVICETRVQGQGAPKAIVAALDGSPPIRTSTSSSSPAAEGASRISCRSATSMSCAPSPGVACRSCPLSATSRTRRYAISPPTHGGHADGRRGARRP